MPVNIQKHDQISVKTLRMMDEAMKNFAKGIVGNPVALEELKAAQQTKNKKKKLEEIK